MDESDELNIIHSRLLAFDMEALMYFVNFSPLPLQARRANARNVGFETLYCGQFTSSTRLMKPSRKQVRLYLSERFQ